MDIQFGSSRLFRLATSLTIAVFVLALLPGWAWQSSAALAAGETARIRVVHAVPDAGAVDVYVAGKKVLSDVTFFTVSAYLEIAPGSYKVQVVRAGQQPSHSTSIFEGRLSFAAGKDYSVVARGTVATNDSKALGGTLLEDDNSAPAAGQARLRVAHFSPDAPAVDIYANGAKVVSGLSYTNASAYLSVPAGSYTIGVAPAGGAVIYTTTATLTAGQVVTAWANGLLGGSGAQAFKVTPTVDRAGSSPPSAAGRLRVLHGAPGAPGVDVFLNGERVVAGLAFANITAYRPVTAGTVAVQLKVAGSDTVVYNGGVTVDAGQDFTVAAIGAAGGSAALQAAQAAQLNLSVLKDDNTPQAGQAKLRFIHFAPNAPPVDLRAGQRVLFNDVSYGTGGSYQTAQPGVVTASVTSADGSQSLLSATITLKPDAVTTVFAVGLVGNVPPEQRLQALVVDDSATGAAQRSQIYLPMSVR